MPALQRDEPLTEAQRERRARVLRAALELGAEGGYDAVQMRDVAARAEVAMGTVYRYFASKDHLLGEAMVAWVGDLEGRVVARPPAGATPAEQVADILRRATRAMAKEPRLSAAVLAAISSGDPNVAHSQAEAGRVVARVQERALHGFDEAERAGITRALSHVWYSVMLAWANGWLDLDGAVAQLDEAAHLLIDPRS